MNDFGFWGHLDLGIYHLWFGMGLFFPSPEKPGGKFGVLLHAEFLLKEQVAFVVRRPFAQVQVVRHLYPFLDRRVYT